MEAYRAAGLVNELTGRARTDRKAAGARKAIVYKEGGGGWKGGGREEGKDEGKGDFGVVVGGREDAN